MLRLTALPRLAALAVLLLGSSLAQAQYSWIGENGVRHFSDRPPPPGTPQARILKQPGRAPDRAMPEPATAPAAAEAKPPSALAQQEAAFQQRQKAREAEEKKEAEQAARRVAQAERCESARQVKAQAAAGLRQVRIDAQGERVVLSDEEKAAKVARADKALLGCS